LTAIKQKGRKIVHAWAFKADCDPRAIASKTITMEWPPKSEQQLLDLPLATGYRNLGKKFIASFTRKAVMRYVWLLLFVIIVAIICVFAYENNDPVAINYLDGSLSVQSIHLPMSVLIGATYVLGMLTGWIALGFLKRTVQHITQK
jgi:uncharacterized integral membrane protein